MGNDGNLCVLDINLCHKIVSIMNYVCKGSKNYETKEGRVKNPSKVLPYHIFCVPLHSKLSHKTAGDPSSGVH